MTRDEVRHLWGLTASAIVAKAKLLDEATPKLDEPFWSGTFDGPQGPLEEQAMTLRETLVHLCIALWEVPRALVEGTGFEPVKEASAALQGSSIANLQAALAEREAKLLAWLETLSTERLAEVVETPLGAKSVGEVLLFTALHATHHKGQLMQLLRLSGVRPGRFF
ncbi:MAG: DinB family protein [Fimbriimonadaceae bacterium]|nr:DinB family protein [Fimbriimonadaceae bacterium]